MRLCGIYSNLRKSEATVQPYNLKTEEVEACETSVSNFPVTIQHGRLPLVKHNLYANLEKNPEICKELSKDLVN